MIELNSKTQQDFLNREWVQKLLDAGVDMYLDAKYMLYVGGDLSVWIIERQPKHTYAYCKPRNILPTYTVSELLYKLHEWIYPTIDGKEYAGPLRVLKDAPFYICWYDLSRSEKVQTAPGWEETTRIRGPEDYIYAKFEYPIESLASLLIQCHKKDIGIDRKDTGNISDK